MCPVVRYPELFGKWQYYDKAYINHIIFMAGWGSAIRLRTGLSGIPGVNHGASGKNKFEDNDWPSSIRMGRTGIQLFLVTESAVQVELHCEGNYL